MIGVLVQTFLKGIGQLDPNERIRLAAHLTDSDEGRKAGETLLLILDRLTDFDKPALLGFFLRQFADERISALELRRLAIAVDLAFADDLKDFLDEPADAGTPKLEWTHRERLVAAGLTRVLVGDTWETTGAVYYGRTELGELLSNLAESERR